MAAAHRNVPAILQRHGYTEIKKIGEGSFGKAILVQAKDGSRIVCKMVDVSKASQKETQAAMKEGQLLAQLKHPYIVRYRENFNDNGWLCILMDYCDGGDLCKPIEQAKKNRSPIKEDQVLRWFTQAMLALKYIHDRHILHRDLKPGNFFLSKSGNLKMGDFGIAKVLSSTIACARTQIGTPYYLSPEVCQEKPYAWGSDIWAMGCILYELCAAKVPFDAPNISGLVQRIIRGPIPQVPNQYSAWVRELTGQMLNRDPKKRPGSDEILKKTNIQTLVRQMLDEAQGDKQEGGGGKEKREITTQPSAEAYAQQPAPVAASPGRGNGYQQGDLVEYFSTTHGDWLPAAVVKVDSSGGIIVDLKPNTWISKDESAKKVRRRVARGPSPAPSAAAKQPSSARGRAPSADGGPTPRRSPSAGPLQQVGAMDRQRGRSPSPEPGQAAAAAAAMRQVAAACGAKRGESPARHPSESPSRPSRAATPSSRANSPAPAAQAGGAAWRAASPKAYREGGAPPGIRPPCMPRGESPLRRKNPAAGAAGAAIAGAGGA